MSHVTHAGLVGVEGQGDPHGGIIRVAYFRAGGKNPGLCGLCRNVLVRPGVLGLRDARNPSCSPKPSLLDGTAVPGKLTVTQRVSGTAEAGAWGSWFLVHSTFPKGRTLAGAFQAVSKHTQVYVHCPAL